MVPIYAIYAIYAIYQIYAIYAGDMIPMCKFDNLHRSECSSLGGYLASIHNREEDDFVFNLIQPHADDDLYGSMWLGGNCPCWGCTFEWDDGTAWIYENWNQGNVMHFY